MVFPSSSAGKQGYKPYNECSESQKRRLKVQLAQDCQPLVSTYLEDDCTGISMVIWNAEECQTEVIMFSQQDADDRELTSMALLVKDCHCISGKL